ncbi:MAG TPA: hypothetical protein VGJ50_22080 [Streptosporangiaceae bacterium]|jgi:hypothetical protein
MRLFSHRGCPFAVSFLERDAVTAPRHLQATTERAINVINSPSGLSSSTSPASARASS